MLLTDTSPLDDWIELPPANITDTVHMVKGVDLPMMVVSDMATEKANAEDESWMEVGNVEDKDWHTKHNSAARNREVKQSGKRANTTRSDDRYTLHAEDPDLDVGSMDRFACRTLDAEGDNGSELLRPPVYELGIRRPQIKSRAYRGEWEEQYTLDKEQICAKDDFIGKKILEPDSWETGHDPDAEHDSPVEARNGIAIEEGWGLIDLSASNVHGPPSKPVSTQTATKAIQVRLSSKSIPSIYSSPGYALTSQTPIPPAPVDIIEEYPRPKPAWHQWDDRDAISSSYPSRKESIDITEGEDLETFAADFKFHSANIEHEHGGRLPLNEPLLSAFVERSVATTNKLVADGKMALASKASQIVARVLANEQATKCEKVNRPEPKKEVRRYWDKDTNLTYAKAMSSSETMGLKAKRWWEKCWQAGKTSSRR